jgi:hypothetical protein
MDACSCPKERRFEKVGRSRVSRSSLSRAAPTMAPQSPRIIAAKMGLIICHYFQCRTCASPIVLPAQKIGNMFGGLLHRSIDAQFLAFPCSFCKHVEGYSLHPGSPYNDERYMTSLLDPPEVETASLDWLRCVDGDCRSRVPLFAQWTVASTAEERLAYIATWEWEHLRCPEGHEIHIPKFYL